MNWRYFTYRDGKSETKKMWYNVACAISSLIMIKLSWTLPTAHGMDDTAFIWLFGVYLICVGGFDVLLEVLRLFKGVPETSKEEQ